MFASSVSVPIPGTISPNCNLYWYKNVLDIKRFRPHSGDYISKSAKVSGIYNSWVKGVSVPIPGTISPNNVYSNHKVNNNVSVPIPGTISPNKLFKQKNGWRYCFRPHSGDYISKCYIGCFTTKGLTKFPSPFRGLYLQILSSTPTVFLHSQEYYAWESKLYMEI